MSMKNSSDTIGNRNRDLLACSAVPQPTALPRAPHYVTYVLQIAAVGDTLYKIKVCRLML